MIRVLPATKACYDAFYKQFPGDVCYYADGEPATYRGNHVYSYASQAWRNYAGTILARIINHVNRQDYAEHLIGMKLAMGMSAEWWWWSSVEINKRSIDHSDAMRQRFSELLRTRYSDNVDALRDAWDDAKVTFDDPQIPHDKQRYSMTDLFVMDPQTHRREIDFLDAYSQAINDTAIYLVRVIKNASAGKYLFLAICGTTTRRSLMHLKNSIG